MEKIIDVFKKAPDNQNVSIDDYRFFSADAALTLYGLESYIAAGTGKRSLSPRSNNGFTRCSKRILDRERISVRHNRLSVYRRCGSGQCHRTDPCGRQQSKRRSNYLSIDQRLLPQNDFCPKVSDMSLRQALFHLGKCRVDRH